jgi:O-antigen/teichoic acid export membrane protein
MTISALAAALGLVVAVLLRLLWSRRRAAERKHDPELKAVLKRIDDKILRHDDPPTRWPSKAEQEGFLAGAVVGFTGGLIVAVVGSKHALATSTVVWLAILALYFFVPTRD